MSDSRTSLRLEALGPLQVYRGPAPVDLGPTKQRAMLAALSLHVGHTVSVESLLDAIWGDEQPTSARQLVHTYVARLRRILEPEMPPRCRCHIIRSAPGGYQLFMNSDSIDVTRFKLLHRQGTRCLAADEPVRAFDLLGEAMRLWRDPALTELCELLRVTETIDALRQTWSDAALDYVGVGIDLGHPSAVLSVARHLAEAEPMHEVVQARYLAALEQTGQRGAAIEHFNHVRVMLSEELGVAPGPHLSGAYHSVLHGTRPRPATRLPTPDVTAPAQPPWRGPGPGLDRLIHRDEDLDAVTGILAEQRLLTVTGPPGCGKSALALQAAAELRADFLGGVVVLECSGLAGAAQLARDLVRMLDGEPEADDVGKLLGDQQVLVVLDNVEHLVDPCACLVDEVVRVCRHVSVIVTSTEPLGLPYETIVRLHTLTVPKADEPRWVGDRPAVQLFARRAAQVCPGFRLGPDNAETVAGVCERLDDLPLAVEMAAACLATDSLDELVGRLDNPLHELRPQRRGKPVHQHSLRTALRRSLDCLNEDERWCFLRLANLPHWFKPAAAQQAWECASSGPVDGRAMLSRLVDKSLLFVRHEPGGPRYGMLRLVRQFGTELVASELS